jgi:hypothetical protein
VILIGYDLHVGASRSCGSDVDMKGDWRRCPLHEAGNELEPESA